MSTYFKVLWKVTRITEAINMGLYKKKKDMIFVILLSCYETERGFKFFKRIKKQKTEYKESMALHSFYIHVSFT